MCDEDLSSYIQRVRLVLKNNNKNKNNKCTMYHSVALRRGSLETGLATMLATAGETLQTLVISQCNIMITDRWLKHSTQPYIT